MFVHVKMENDANYLLHVLKELRQCSLNHEITTTSQHHCTTTMTLNSASGMTSSLINQSEDEQILDLQNRLQFAKNVQVCQWSNAFLLFICLTLVGSANWSKSTCDLFGCTFISK